MNCYNNNTGWTLQQSKTAVINVYPVVIQWVLYICIYSMYICIYVYITNKKAEEKLKVKNLRYITIWDKEGTSWISETVAVW